jgi:hypothetical protein
MDMRNCPICILLDSLGCIWVASNSQWDHQREGISRKHFMVENVSANVSDCRLIMKVLCGFKWKLILVIHVIEKKKEVNEMNNEEKHDMFLQFVMMNIHCSFYIVYENRIK